MTKADIVNEISKNTGIEKAIVLATVEQFMDTVKGSLAKGHKKLPAIFQKTQQSLFPSIIFRHLNLPKHSWEKLNN